MSYPGNSTLSPDIRARILSTFRQTLSLAGKGSRQEALLGCDFILRLDPLFEPARTLHDRIEAAAGAVEVADLEPYAAVEETEETTRPGLETLTPGDGDGGPTPGLEPLPEEAPGAGELELDAPGAGEAPDGGDAGDGADGDVAAKLRRQFAKRDFARVLALAEGHQALIAADPELQQLASTAAEHLQAAPYVDRFLQGAARAAARGAGEEAMELIEKARQLDPEHPGVERLRQQLRPADALDEEEIAAEPPAEGAGEQAVAQEEAAPQDAAADVPPAEGGPPTPSLEPIEGEFVQPAVKLDSESEARIAELLQEGQGAFQDGRYQEAIDAWSRIFLIDIDHAEANRRIELARKLKAEVERKIEEAFHEGMSRLEAGKLGEATEAFERVLEMQPNHLAAREYLDKIESGELAPGRSKPAPAAAAAPRPEPAEEEEFEVDEEALAEAAPPPAEPARPPAEMFRSASRQATVAPAGFPRKRAFAAIGGAVLLLVLVGGWLLYSRREQVFPNSADPDAPTTAVADPISRARSLHEEGKTAIAVAQLRRLPPDHPQHAEAQALVTQWETARQPEEATGPTPEELARREELVAAARDTAGQGDNLTAASSLEQAAAIAPLDAEEAALRQEIRERLEPLAGELDLYRQGDWEYALPRLWRLRQTYPDNPDVERLIVDSYVNLGIRDLQRGDPAAAADKFKEARELAPDDEELQRLAAFASRYEERPSDLQYRIFVKYHPFRS